ncbi:MAG TPA: ARMT1-like domain-containing protein, partial [Chitinivibrionales bacterium]
LSCIIDDIVDALALLKAPRKDIDAIMSEVLLHLAHHLGDNEPASYYITEMHRIVKRRLNLDMPFADLRQICLTACMEIARDVAAEAAKLSGIEKMRFLIRWTIAANTLDFRTAGAGYGIAIDRIETMLRRNFDAGLEVDDCDKIFERLTQARRIVYVPDNVGELPFDKLLIAEIRSYGPIFTVPFRGGPITSDVVMADAEAVGMEEAADEIILSGPDTLGVSFKEMTDECRKALSDADVIIGKGQANFYVLSEFGEQYPRATVISLFATKCNYVSRQFGFEGKVNIASVLKAAGGRVTIGKSAP